MIFMEKKILFLSTNHMDNKMNDKIGWTIYEQTNLMPINFTERALKYLYIDKLDPKSKIWVLLPGGI